MTTVILASLVILVVLVGPIFVAPIERNVELFFLAVGLLTAVFAGQLDAGLVKAAIFQPLPFTLAVLVFGIVFRASRHYLDRLLARLVLSIEPHRICFAATIILAALAPFITPVIAALVLVELIALLRFEESTEIWATVLGCFAIGIGSGITPLGMPAIAVVLHSLHADFWYLARLLGPYVAIGVILSASPMLVLPMEAGTETVVRTTDSWTQVSVVRPMKVYLFIAGLVMLAGGLRPTLDRFLPHLPSVFLFWLNTISAVVDNSALAAIEIGPTLSASQQRAAFLGLLISGGILIPGAIPNVVAASRLAISSRRWGRIGLRMGIPLLVLCFLYLLWSG